MNNDQREGDLFISNQQTFNNTFLVELKLKQVSIIKPKK